MTAAAFHGGQCACAGCMAYDIDPAAATEREMHDLERRMYALAWDDPERQKVVDRYNAVCDELGVPSGDK